MVVFFRTRVIIAMLSALLLAAVPGMAFGEERLVVGSGQLDESAQIDDLAQDEMSAQAVQGCKLVRLAGKTRYDTMSAIVDKGFASSDWAVIASGANYPDALAASALAGSKKCPVLLTDPNSLTSKTKNELARLGVKNVYVMGGTSAISNNVVTQIRNAGINVTRVSGKTRQETSAAAMKRVSGLSDTVVIAYGSGFADTLSIGAWSYWSKSPIVLTRSDGTLGADELAAIKAAGYKKYVIVGGTAVVSSKVEDQMKSAGVSKETRIAGKNRYRTSTLIAKWCIGKGMSCARPAVATGKNYPDALSGAAFCGSRGMVMALLDNTSTAFTDVLSENSSSIEEIYVFGGVSAVEELAALDLAESVGAQYSAPELTQKDSIMRKLDGWWQTFGQSGSVFHHFVRGTDYIYVQNYRNLDLNERRITQTVTSAERLAAGKVRYISSACSFITLSGGTTYMLADSNSTQLMYMRRDGTGYSGSSSLGRISGPPDMLGALAGSKEP